MAVSIISANAGDEVALETPEYQSVNDGMAIQVFTAAKVAKTYTREGLLNRKTVLQAEITAIDTVITEMDKLGIK
jgi:hypothetical protein